MWRSLVAMTFVSVGCRSYVEIRDVTAERGEGDQVVVRFRADCDVTGSFDHVGADLRLRYRGPAIARSDKLVVVPGSPYLYKVVFPPSPELKMPGRYELGFWAYGAMSGGRAGSFYTNEATMEYVVP